MWDIQTLLIETYSVHPGNVDPVNKINMQELHNSWWNYVVPANLSCSWPWHNLIVFLNHVNTLNWSSGFILISVVLNFQDYAKRKWTIFQ